MPKNIVVCCDGTGNEYGKKNTNVVKLFEILDKDTNRQIAFYDPGVGTFSTPTVLTYAQKSITRILGLAFNNGFGKLQGGAEVRVSLDIGGINRHIALQLAF